MKAAGWLQWAIVRVLQAGFLLVFALAAGGAKLWHGPQDCGLRPWSDADGRAEGWQPAARFPPHSPHAQVSEVLLFLSFPLAVWANTRTSTDADLRRWLRRAGIGRSFAWVVTSVDAGFRKPAPEFFDFALAKCGLSKAEVLFVGNQRNTDITGGEQYGMRTVWLCGRPFRSADETLSPKDVRPTYTIRTFRQPPLLLRKGQSLLEV